MAACLIGVGYDGSEGFTRYVSVLRGRAASLPDEPGQDAVLQEQYDAALALYDAQEYEKAFEAFEALGEFSDSRARAAGSRRKWKAESYQEAMAFYKAEQFYEAREIFERLENYEKSRSYVRACTEEIQRMEYRQAKELYAAGDYDNAILLFESLGRYSDSREYAKAAADRIQEREQAEAELRLYETALALKEAGDLEGARDALIEAGDCRDATDQIYAIVSLLALRAAYERAEAFFHNGDFENAQVWFRALGDYENSADRADRAREAWQAAVYEQATAALGTDPGRAYILLLSLGDYKDGAGLADGLKVAATWHKVYTAAVAMEQRGDYWLARIGFEAILPYADSRERVARLGESIRQTQDFQQAMFLRAIGEVEQANALFMELGDFEGASKRVEPVIPRFSAKQLRDDRTSPKSPVFIAPDGTRHHYRIYKGVPTWVEAKAFCDVLGGHLATLTTAEENEFVYQFMRDSGFLTAYFGLSDEERTGNWEWVTGEPFAYSNWHPGEPSRSPRERYGMYLYLHTEGTWNDSHFYETGYPIGSGIDRGCSFICEWDE